MLAVSFASGRSASSRSTRSLAPAVELADVERAAAADEDPARRQVVGAEVDERADGALLADDRGDQRLVDAVLQRDDEAVRREPRRDRRRARPPVCCDLTASSTAPRSSGSSSGETARRLDGELLDRPLDRAARAR